MGNMGTTMSPNSARHPVVKFASGRGSKKQKFKENHETLKENSLTRQIDNNGDDATYVEAKQLKAASFKPVPTQQVSADFAPGLIKELADKCSKEQGFCASFQGCDTVTHIYKGYCSSDYSQVCCVPRLSVCEANDGLCTDDREACEAAGAIMSQKYNIEFFTWMTCDSSRVCCRPRKSSKKFEAFVSAFQSDDPVKRKRQMKVQRVKPTETMSVADKQKTVSSYMDIEQMQDQPLDERAQKLLTNQQQYKVAIDSEASSFLPNPKSRRNGKKRQTRQQKRNTQNLKRRRRQGRPNTGRSNYVFAKEDLSEADNVPVPVYFPSQKPKRTGETSRLEKQNFMNSLMKPLLSTGNILEDTLEPNESDLYGFRDYPVTSTQDMYDSQAQYDKLMSFFKHIY